MTFSQLETLVWSWLDDPYMSYFTKAQVDVWLNNAQREAQKQLLQMADNYYVLRVSGATIANTDTYVLPTDFRKLHKFELVLSGTPPNEVRQTLTPVTLIQIDQISQTTGTPTCYNIKRNTFTMRPIPDIIYNMYLHYSYRVVDMVNPNDLPDVPQDYHEYLAVLATIDGFMKDQRDPSAFITGKREYYQMMMKQDAQDRDVSAPRSVVMTEDLGYGSLF